MAITDTVLPYTYLPNLSDFNRLAHYVTREVVKELEPMPKSEYHMQTECRLARVAVIFFFPIVHILSQVIPP